MINRTIFSKHFMRRLFLGAVMMALNMLSFRLHAQDEVKLKPQTGGWALHLGAGIMFGGNLGLQLENQILLRDQLRISPFVSFGAAEGGTDSVSSEKYYWLGYAAGANLEYGNRHRVFLGPHFEGNRLLGTSPRIEKNYFGGISLVLGYKGMTDFGLTWQVYVGDFYSPDDDPFSAEKKYEHRSHFGLGVGYKF